MSKNGIRKLLQQLLSDGDVMTTAQLRDAVASSDAGLGDVHLERVYRQLDVLVRRGEVARVTHAGRRHVSWIRSASSQRVQES